jgi:hypothetical protein
LVHNCHTTQEKAPLAKTALTFLAHHIFLLPSSVSDFLSLLAGKQANSASCCHFSYRFSCDLFVTLSCMATPRARGGRGGRADDDDLLSPTDRRRGRSEDAESGRKRRGDSPADDEAGFVPGKRRSAAASAELAATLPELLSKLTQYVVSSQLCEIGLDR